MATRTLQKLSMDVMGRPIIPELNAIPLPKRTLLINLARHLTTGYTLTSIYNRGDNLVIKTICYLKSYLDIRIIRLFWLFSPTKSPPSRFFRRRRGQMTKDESSASTSFQLPSTTQNFKVNDKVIYRWKDNTTTESTIDRVRTNNSNNSDVRSTIPTFNSIIPTFSFTMMFLTITTLILTMLSITPTKKIYPTKFRQMKTY